MNVFVEAFAHSYAIAAWVILKGRCSGEDGLYKKTFGKKIKRNVI